MKVINFTPEVKGPKEGRVNVSVKTEYGEMVYRNISVFRKDNRRWYSFPSKKTEQIDERGFEVYESHTGFLDQAQHTAFHKDLFDKLDAFIGAMPLTEEPRNSVQSGAIKAQSSIGDDCPF
jgi:hypothetical protein